MSAQGFIRHPMLERCGVAHGFGTRSSVVPDGTFFPRQVHGTNVHCVSGASGVRSDDCVIDADAVYSTVSGQSVAIVTADCVPILACTQSGSGVLAVHAGWRGLASGVIEAGVKALKEATRAGETLCAVIGPHIGECCYEVDAPVLDAMSKRFGQASTERASTMTRPGHARIALGTLAALELERAGVARSCCAQIENSCTSCEAARFHSYRRDGEAAGRMAHFIATPYA